METNIWSPTSAALHSSRSTWSTCTSKLKYTFTCDPLLCSLWFLRILDFVPWSKRTSLWTSIAVVRELPHHQYNTTAEASVISLFWIFPPWDVIRHLVRHPTTGRVWQRSTGSTPRLIASQTQSIVPDQSTTSNALGAHHLEHHLIPAVAPWPSWSQLDIWSHPRFLFSDLYIMVWRSLEHPSCPIPCRHIQGCYIFTFAGSDIACRLWHLTKEACYYTSCLLYSTCVHTPHL